MKAKKRSFFKFGAFRFVTDASHDDTGFFLTWAEVPGTPGCGGLLAQVTNSRHEHKTADQLEDAIASEAVA